MWLFELAPCFEMVSASIAPPRWAPAALFVKTTFSMFLQAIDLYIARFLIVNFRFLTLS